MNAELQRYLWLELSAHRLVATPLLLSTEAIVGYCLGRNWLFFFGVTIQCVFLPRFFTTV